MSRSSKTALGLLGMALAVGAVVLILAQGSKGKDEVTTPQPTGVSEAKGEATAARLDSNSEARAEAGAPRTDGDPEAQAEAATPESDGGPEAEAAAPRPAKGPEALGEATAPQADGGLEAITIMLPEPFFGGTPLNYWGVHLEEEDFKDRPPYLAPVGTAVISKGKAVSSSTKEPLLGELKQITDGDKDYAEASLVELGAGVQWVRIDLEAAHNLYAILFWHFHKGKRVYFDIVVQLSDGPEFKEGVITVYNNDFDNSAGLGVGDDKEYIESNRGRLIKLPEGPAARYVRLYSNGNTDNEMNHYVEVEVFGMPVDG